MRGLFKFFKTHKKCVILFFLLLSVLVVVIPFLINFMFKQASPCDLFTAEWNAGDVLAFYGAVLSFLSTSILSVLALWQNHIIKEENEKHRVILERMEREKNYPLLIIGDVVGHGNAQDLTFDIKNLSDNIAQRITVSNFCIRDEKEKEIIRIEKECYIDYLTRSAPYKINLTNPPITEKSHKICFDLQYYDLFDEIHKCNVLGFFSDKGPNPVFKIKERLNKDY